MKKKNQLAIILFFVLFSCSKDDKPVEVKECWDCTHTYHVYKNGKFDHEFSLKPSEVCGKTYSEIQE
jgi:hypothetical protein